MNNKIVLIFMLIVSCTFMTVGAIMEPTLLSTIEDLEKNLKKNPIRSVIIGSSYWSNKNYVDTDHDAAWDVGKLLNTTDGKVTLMGPEEVIEKNYASLGGLQVTKRDINKSGQIKQVEHDVVQNKMTFTLLHGMKRKTKQLGVEKTSFAQAVLASSIQDVLGSTCGYTSTICYAGSYIQINPPEQADNTSTADWSDLLSPQARQILENITDCYFEKDSSTGQYTKRDVPDLNTHLDLINKWEKNYGNSFVSRVNLTQFGYGFWGGQITNSSAENDNENQTTSSGGALTMGSRVLTGTATSDDLTNQLKNSISVADFETFIIGMPGNCSSYQQVRNNINTAVSAFTPDLITKSNTSGDLAALNGVEAPSLKDVIPTAPASKDDNKDSKLKDDDVKKDQSNELKKDDQNKEAEESDDKQDEAADQLTDDPETISQIVNPEYEIGNSEDTDALKTMKELSEPEGKAGGDKAIESDAEDAVELM